MNPGMTLRLVVFFTTIVSLAALLAWTAHMTWRQTVELQERLSTNQWKSFQIADHLQQVILGLNNSVLRYAAYRQPEDWTQFDVESRQLGDWINEQTPVLFGPAEPALLGQIKAAYSNYLAAADAIHQKIYGTRVSLIRVFEFTDFERQSKLLLDLGFQLAKLQQQSLDAYQRQATRSIALLRFSLVGSLALLLGAGFWLAVVVYREMIRPLQVQLVESRRLLERQEKLASLGMLAAGVAHEIRNPLTAIKAWLYMQQKHLKPGTPEHEDAALIGGEISRLERIVKDFLQFARPSEPAFAVVAAGQPLREVQELMQPQLAKSKIKLELEHVAPVEVRVDPEQIKQVLINLVQNAAESIGKEGTVWLRARLDSKRLNDHPNDVVILEVADTGKGIPPEAEKRLFDPFFTTKANGTGLGLPIAARIVEKNHGALQYQNQPGAGATFGIILPIHPP